MKYSFPSFLICSSQILSAKIATFLNPHVFARHYAIFFLLHCFLLVLVAGLFGLCLAALKIKSCHPET